MRQVINDRVHSPDLLYIAGSSTEMDRVREFMRLAILAGWNITHDWTQVIDGVGEANPADATREQRESWADADIGAIKKADVVVFLLPRDGAAARGSYFEFGYATAIEKHTIAVTSPVAVSIFNAKAVKECPEDVDALALLGHIARGFLP